MPHTSNIDRLSVRERPAGPPIMHQIWDELLFLHWRMPPVLLEPLIPSGLELDTIDGSAWISVTPFTMRGVRPSFAPALPMVSSFHELNVRTYVVGDGVPGVWFFSLDASNSVAVLFARLGFSLPYYRASMSLLRDEDGTVRFSSHRNHRDAPEAGLDAKWRRLPLHHPEGTYAGAGHEGTVGDGIGRVAEPGTLEFFLIERYCLYSLRGDQGRRARIFHKPWRVTDAEVLSLHSTMIESHGLTTPDTEPLVQAQTDALEVEVWPLRPL